LLANAGRRRGLLAVTLPIVAVAVGIAVAVGVPRRRSSCGRRRALPSGRNEQVTVPLVSRPGSRAHVNQHPWVLLRVRLVADGDLVLVLGARAGRAERERRGAEDAERHQEG